MEMQGVNETHNANKNYSFFLGASNNESQSMNDYQRQSTNSVRQSYFANRRRV
jgi:hypothetical protein